MLPAVGVGNALIVTDVDAVAVQPAALVTVTLYVPAFADVAFIIVGFCDEDVNPFGPDHV